MVIASLLLPELLSLLGWWGLLWCGRSPETQALLWGKGNNVGGEAGCTGASTVSSAIRFTEFTSANKERPEYRITGASVAGKIRSQAPFLLIFVWPEFSSGLAFSRMDASSVGGIFGLLSHVEIAAGIASVNDA